MTKSSRFVRPISPQSGIILQERDRKIIQSVYTHRYMRSKHIHQLLFAKVSLRVVQARLRKLWEWGFLERYFVPQVFVSGQPTMSYATQPIYGLGKAGGELLFQMNAEQFNEVVRPPKKMGLFCLEHHLIVTDFLVSLETAEFKNNWRLQSVESETALWRKLAAWRNQGGIGQVIVPDGAFTLVCSQTGQTQSFYLEVVRAGVSGGNRSLLEKWRRYVQLSKDGFFSRVYGHKRIRAVITITGSKKRSENLRLFAAELKYGCRMFWFGLYQKPNIVVGRVSENTLKADSILDARWQTADEEVLSIIPNDELSS